MKLSTLKERAMGLCRVSKPNLVAAGAIYYGLTTLVNALSSRLLGGNLTESQAEKYLEAYQSGDLERCLAIASKCAPSNSACVIHFALQLVLGIVGVGVVIFILNTVRGSGASYGNLLDGFGIAPRAVLLRLLQDVLVFAWSLLLFVPGIVAAYRFSLAKYLMIDRPDLSVWACLRESSRLMKGHKWELFRLDLSLLGWTLLGAFLPLAAIFTVPYTGTVRAQYYEELTGAAAKTV